MKALLINPNRYKSPPVPPIGLEYVASSLVAKGHKVSIADMCFAEDWRQHIDQSVEDMKPDIAGVTVRNVDTVLYHTNEFFLDEIREIVHYLQAEHRLRVIIGGAGVTANPYGMLEYLNADSAVEGPAEDAIHVALYETLDGRGSKKVYKGRYSGRTVCPRRTFGIDYDRYFSAGAVIGFETHKGCSSSCVFCLEANTRVAFKPVQAVVEEIRSFADKGYTHFHLCDSEFNENLEYSVEFCTALKKAGMEISWAVYMKPAEFNKPLLKLLKDTGVYLITLSMDSWKKCALYWTDYEKLVFSARSLGIKVAVDFITGFPYETDAEILGHFDTLRRPLPDSIGVNTYIRLYKKLRITGIILKDAALRTNLSGRTDDATLLQPVFYNEVDTEKLGELIGGDPLFRIEGPEKGVNYGRVKQDNGNSPC